MALPPELLLKIATDRADDLHEECLSAEDDTPFRAAVELAQVSTLFLVGVASKRNRHLDLDEPDDASVGPSRPADQATLHPCCNFCKSHESKIIQDVDNLLKAKRVEEILSKATQAKETYLHDLQHNGLFVLGPHKDCVTNGTMDPDREDLDCSVFLDLCYADGCDIGIYTCNLHQSSVLFAGVERPRNELRKEWKRQGQRMKNGFQDPRTHAENASQASTEGEERRKDDTWWYTPDISKGEKQRRRHEVQYRGLAPGYALRDYMKESRATEID